MEWYKVNESSGNKPSQREETTVANVPGGVIVRVMYVALNSTPAVSSSMVFVPGDIEVRWDDGSFKILPKVKPPITPEP